jgi:gamma-glutamyltranspeptidase/glutathione hydrolase
MAPELVSSIRSSSPPGVLAENDLRNYWPVERMPICASYDRMRLCAFPPPSYGGIAVLEILQILDQLHAGYPDFLNADFVHAFVEAGRIAEADRADTVGDPDIEKVLVAAFLDPRYIEQRAKLVSRQQSIKDPVEGGAISGPTRPTCLGTAAPPSPSTSQIVVVDRWGAALSMTTTINVNFGSWLTVRGFFLNNAMTNFTCATNRAAANKRPETSMAPVMAVDRAGHTVLVGGSAGGGEIVDYVAQAILQITHGITPLEALDTGHVSTSRAPYSNSAGRVELEDGRAVASLSDRLRKLGHDVRVTPLQSGLGFVKWQNGVWVGAADPRRGGNSLTGK